MYVEVEMCMWKGVCVCGGGYLYVGGGFVGGGYVDCQKNLF